MEDLFDDTMIKLTDGDFDLSHKPPTITHPSFKGKHGYIMAYAPWCPHCQEQKKFWSYLGQKLNRDPSYRKQEFRVGVINSSDPETRQVLQDLQVDTIPRFYHVTPKNGRSHLTPYQGGYTPEELLHEACAKTGRLCSK